MDELIFRVLRGEAEPIEELRLAKWRAESRDNHAHFSDVRAIWTATGSIADDQEPIPAPPTVESLINRGEARRRSDVRRRFARALRRPQVWPMAAAAAIAMVSLGVWIGGGERAGSDLAGTEFLAGSTEASTFALSDGSFVRLAPGTRVRFAEDGDVREVWLSGRAFFGVTSDPDRPFVIHTTLGEARVLGTRFEVAERDDELRVIVIEGRVSMTSNRGRLSEVEAGQVGRLAANGDFSVTTVDDVYSLLDWEGGLLVFQGTPLAQVAEEVGAHFGVPVTLGDELPALTLTAWFGDDSLNEVAESICLLIRAECTIDDNQLHISR